LRLSEKSESSYNWWRNALKGEFGPIYESDPQPGYYRMRKGKGGPWVPVAIWAEPAEFAAPSDLNSSGLRLNCLVGGLDRDAHEVWTWCCRYPVSYEAYVAVAERGEGWPEDLPAELHAELERFDRSRHGDAVRGTSLPVTSSGSASASISSSTAISTASIGHNSSGVAEAESFIEEIEIVLKSANDWLEGLGSIASQVEADKAANYAERFSNLETRAEEARTLEKRPVLDLGRQIDAKWKPVIAKASDGKVRMKKALEPYLIAERDRRIARGSNANEIEPPRAGTSGRRIGLRSRQVISITDQNALNLHYQTDPRIWLDKSVKDLVQKLAETDLMAGLSIPGASLIEELSAA